MKKKVLILLSVVFVFGMVAASFAYVRANNAGAAAENSASCPMHKQMAANGGGEHKDSCCGSGDCCKDGKCSMGGACCKDDTSCPMKKNSETKSTGGNGDTEMSKVMGDGENGGSCCQKGGACCKGGGAACCHKKK